MIDKILPFHHIPPQVGFLQIRNAIWNLFLSWSHTVPATMWQGVDTTGKPDMVSQELMNVTFTHNLGGIEDVLHWEGDIQPNLPWADHHFKERVCGYPINPGIQWQNWPWGASADGHRNDRGMFNHNYMERYWPKKAAVMSDTPTRTAEEHQQYKFNRNDNLVGIRNEYGDLDDLVEQLVRNPLSRQEWFPIFYPEDVGEVVGNRKPCSLGYQFMVRNNKLHCYYPLRSCDFFHHMQDDIYLTVRLMMWILDECRSHEKGGSHPPFNFFWENVTLGTLTMHCTSLHVFANDFNKMKLEGFR